MVWVRTQAEVCEYFGKNPDGRTFVSRMIAKGKVRKEQGGYEILEEGSTDKVVVDKDKVKELEEEVKKLKAELSECNKNVTQGYTQSDMDYVQGIIEGQDVEISELQNIILEIYKTLGKTSSWQDFKRRYGITFTVPGEEE